MVGRFELMVDAAALVEKDLTIVGASAIEDKLQVKTCTSKYGYQTCTYDCIPFCIGDCFYLRLYVSAIEVVTCDRLYL